MRFLRLEQTRPAASAAALAAWTAGFALMVYTGRSAIDTAPLLVLFFCTVLPALLLFSPVLLPYIALRAGRVTAIACAVSGLLISALYGHLYLAAAVALTQLPVAIFSVYSYERKLPFWRSVGISCGILLTAGMLVLGGINLLYGGDAITALRNLLEPLVRSAPDTDQSLLWLAQIGFVNLPDSVLPGIQVSSAVKLDEVIREELIKQFMFTSESTLRLALPSQILQSAILSGLLCVTVPRKVATKFATQMDTAPMPAYHEWYIPANLFKPMALTVVAVGVLMLLSGSQAMIDLFNLLWAGIGTVIALQGGALLAFLMRKSGIRSGQRILLVAALMVLLNFLLIMLGFADQFLNPRMLRKPTNDNRDEEDNR